MKPREEEEQSGRSRSRNPAATDNNEHNPTARKRTVKGNRSDTDDNERHFLQLTQTQQGSVNTAEHNNKEDNKKKEEDVEMKNTAEIDPFQTTDPWKDAVEPNKSQEKPLEEQDNTEGSLLKVITNEQVTDKKTECQPRIGLSSPRSRKQDSHHSSEKKKARRNPSRSRTKAKYKTYLKKKHQTHSG